MDVKPSHWGPAEPSGHPPLRWGRLAHQTVLGAAEQLLSTDSPQRLSVMIFHRILPETDRFLAGDPTADEFSAVMAVVRERFHPIRLAEGVRRLQDGTLPQRSVCVTFDDGYADNLEVAAPILKDLQIPATVFVATGYLDGRSMWNDRLSAAIRQAPGEHIDLNEFDCGQHPVGDLAQRAQLASFLIRQLKYRPSEEREQIAGELAARYAPNMRSPMMTRDQVRQLRAEGIEIGGHTVTHPILARTDDDRAFQEIAENKEDLEGLLGERLRFFAYPNGKPGQDFAPIHSDMVKRAGYRGALTTRPGVSTAGTDPFLLPRFTPWDRTPTRFAVRLLLNMRHMV